MDTTCTAVVFGYGYESALWYGGMYRISDQTAVHHSLFSSVKAPSTTRTYRSIGVHPPTCAISLPNPLTTKFFDVAYWASVHTSPSHRASRLNNSFRSFFDLRTALFSSHMSVYLSMFQRATFVIGSACGCTAPIGFCSTSWSGTRSALTPRPRETWPSAMWVASTEGANK